MEGALTGIGILAVLIVWEKIWKPTVLDTTRDKIFDIRDNAREWFLKEGYGLTHPIYHSLRGMLNCHLRHTERASISTYLIYCILREKFSKEDSLLEQEIKNIFNTDDEKLYAYIDTVRKSAGDAILMHMISKSICMSFLVIIFGVFSVSFYMLRTLVLFIKNSVTPTPRYNMAFASVLMWIIAAIPGGYSSNIRVEKYSFSQTSPVCRLNETKQHC